MKTLKERLEIALAGKMGASKADLARACGISRPAVTGWFNGSTQAIEGQNLVRASAFLGVKPDWLATGKGKMSADKEAAADIPAGASVVSYRSLDELDQSDYVLIDRYDIELSAGNGNAQWVVRSKDPLSFRASWFKKKGLHPEACKALYVRGRSMEPKLEDWDTVLIDTSDTDLIDGEIYAVTYKGSFYIKTLERVDGGILLKSENQDHKSVTVPEGDFGRLHILGRKVWRGG